MNRFISISTKQKIMDIAFLAVLFFCGLVMAMLLTQAVFAQAVTTPVPTDLSPIIKSIFEVLASVATAVAVWAGVWLKAWLASKTSLANSELADSIQQRYNEAAERSMNYAGKYATTHIQDAAGKLVANNTFISYAVTYMLKYWPDLTKGLDFDGIGKTIVARLPEPPKSGPGAPTLLSHVFPPAP